MSSEQRPQPGEQLTRERIVDLLRRGPHTADELATLVGLTPNAVRQHLMHLERDRAVVRRGARHSGTAGKPAVLYEAAPEREVLFSRAYAPVLRALLGVLPTHVTREAMDAILADAATRLAGELPAARGDFPQRVATAAAVLNSLGAVTDVSGDDTRACIRGYSCPLGESVAVRPELCRVLGQALQHITGTEVHESCDRSNRPRCRFELLKH